jgi:hypothetical protein
VDDDIDKDGGGDDREDVVIKSGGIGELFRLKWRERGQVGELLSFGRVGGD